MLTKDEKDNVCSMYSSGKSQSELAGFFRVRPNTIGSLLDRRGVAKRPKSITNRWYTHNESAFDDITEDSSYWCGFIMADGNIQHIPGQSLRLQVGLASVDVSHLEKLRTFLSATNPILVHNCKSGMRATIYVTSNPICMALARFGVVPRKTHIAKVLILEDSSAFWRGVMDGDGCILVNNKGYPQFGCTGSLSLMTQLKTYIDGIAPYNKISVRPKGNVFYIQTQGSVAHRLIEVLYKDASVSLDRKQSIADSILGNASPR